MFDFMWHLRGSAALDGVKSSEAALERIEQLLEKQRKGVSDRGPGFVEFEDPLWSNTFGPNWLSMVIYDRGRFWIDQGLHGRRLRYDLRSLHGFVFCGGAALIAFFFGFAGDGLAEGLKYAGVAFGWLYGMNILLALVRVPFAIRKAVAAD